jgi:hypothetical protein
MQTGAEHLIDINKRLHGFVLPDDFLPQRTLELAIRGTAFFRVQNLPRACDLHVSPSAHLAGFYGPIVLL